MERNIYRTYTTNTQGGRKLVTWIQGRCRCGKFLGLHHLSCKLCSPKITIEKKKLYFNSHREQGKESSKRYRDKIKMQRIKII